MSVSSLGPALPSAVAAFVREAVANGAAPYKNVELNTTVPGLGPYTIDNGGAFTITVYPGPVTKFSATPKLGRHVDTTA
ncbi:MAG: hypothetical protein ABW067_16645 [Rhizobacter sp.]|jgi:hypothetical protein